jgi:hypothetical protein
VVRASAAERSASGRRAISQVPAAASIDLCELNWPLESFVHSDDQNQLVTCALRKKTKIGPLI